MSLEKAVEFFLLMEALPDRLRILLDELLWRGYEPEDIYDQVMKAAGGKSSTTTAAVEVYLGLKSKEE